MNSVSNVQDIQNTRYATFMIKYKFAWKTNEEIYINLQENNINYDIKDSINETCEKYNFIVEELVIGQGYVYLCIKSLPRYSPSEIINKIKGVTGRRIGINQNIKKIWDRGYLCFTEGKDDINLLEEYLKQSINKH